MRGEGEPGKGGILGSSREDVVGIPASGRSEWVGARHLMGSGATSETGGCLQGGGRTDQLHAEG